MEKQFDLTSAIVIVLMGAQLEYLEVVKLLVLHRLFYIDIDFHLRGSCDYRWV